MSEFFGFPSSDPMQDLAVVIGSPKIAASVSSSGDVYFNWVEIERLAAEVDFNNGVGIARLLLAARAKGGA